MVSQTMGRTRTKQLSVAAVALSLVALTGCVRHHVQATAPAVYPYAELPAVKAQDDLRVSVLSVGAGMCQVIECPGPKATAIPYVVDCGSTNSTDGRNETETSKYVNNILNQYATPPVVVISHTDKDHNNWIPDVFRARVVSHIWISGAHKDYPPEVRDWIADQTRGGGILHENLPTSQWASMGACSSPASPVSADTEAVTVNVGNTKNSKSLVWAVEYGSAFAMLTADATGPTEKSAQANLTHKGIRPPLPVITGSHHGAASHNSNSQEWASFTRPTAIIYSAGVSKRYGHPRCEATLRYRDHLKDATPHPTRCWNGQWDDDLTYARREYVTRVVGDIVVDFQANGKYNVSCSNKSISCAVVGDVPDGSEALKDK